MNPLVGRFSEALFAIGVLLMGVALVDVGRSIVGPAPSHPPSNTPLEVVARFPSLADGGQSVYLAVASDGSVGLTDRRRDVVVRVDPGGRVLDTWGPDFGAGVVAGDIAGIAATASGWYLLDRAGERVIRLDAAGRAIPDATIDLKPHQTYGPGALAVDGQGLLHLADTGRNRILVFDAVGALVRRIGSQGEAPGRLKQPVGLAFDPVGGLWVAEMENRRLQRWDPDQHPSAMFTPGTAVTGVAVDRLGHVYVPDPDGAALRIFSPEGRPLAEVGGRADSREAINAPSQLAMSRDGGWLWVAGVDGLARLDLRVYGRPSRPQTLSSPTTSLGVAGMVLLLLSALAGTSAPWAFRGGAAWTRLRRLHPQTAVGVTLMPIGIVAAATLLARLRATPSGSQLWPELGGFLVAALVWALGTTLSVKTWPLSWVRPSVLANPPDPAPRVAPGWRRLAAIGILTAATSAALAARTWVVEGFGTTAATWAAALWVVALVVLVGVLLLVGPVRPRRPSAMTLVPWLLFAGALVPRLWSLEELPYGVWYDEAEGGLEARKFLTTGRYTAISDLYGADPTLFFYLMSGAFAVLGDSLLAVRVVPAVVGALAAPVTFLLARELFGWRVGLVAGCLVAVSRWHLNFSRFGMNSISVAVCAALVFWLVARAIRRRGAVDAAWVGLAIGLGLHGYTAFRAYPVVAPLLFTAGAMLRRWPVCLLAARLALLLAAFAIMALPLLVFAQRSPERFNGRMNETLILTKPTSAEQKLQEVWSNVQSHALMFHVRGDRNGRHNLPGEPMLDPATGLLAVFGLAWLLLRLPDWRTVLLLGWGATAMSGGILTLPFEAPQGVRTLGAVPVVCVLAGLALVLVLDRATAVLRAAWPAADRVRGLVPLLASGSAAGLLAFAATWELGTYFGRQARDPRVWLSFSTRETVAAYTYLDDEADGREVLGSATIAPSQQVRFLAPMAGDRVRGIDPASDLPVRGRGPTYLLLSTEHDPALARVAAQRYPRALYQAITPPGHTQTIMEAFRIDPDEVAARRALLAWYRGADGTAAERREPRPDVAADSLGVALPATARWSGALVAPEDGLYGLRVPDGFTLAVDRQTLHTGLDGARVRLARGLHLVEVAGTLASGDRLQLAWQPPGSGEWAIPVGEALFDDPGGGTGLLGAYFPTADWSGDAHEEVIEPVLARYFQVDAFKTLKRPDHDRWSAEWRGFLEAPVAGTYYFSLEAFNVGSLWIDDELLVDGLSPTGRRQDVPVELTQGLHRIHVRLRVTGGGGPHVYLHWWPPRSQRELVPGRYLYPAPPGTFGPAAPSGP